MLLRAARSDAERLFLAVDPAWQAMSDASRAASRSPAKGGAPNALFVAAALESLPLELLRTADELRVILPWGSLLDAVWAPKATGLAALHALCQPGARMEVVVAIVAGRDGDLCDEPSPLCVATYREAGFDVLGISELAAGELRAVGTTWAKRLAARPGQRVWRIVAKAV